LEESQFRAFDLRHHLTPTAEFDDNNTPDDDRRIAAAVCEEPTDFARRFSPQA
jgi:hypothetical protein